MTVERKKDARKLLTDISEQVIVKIDKTETNTDNSPDKKHESPQITTESKNNCK
jgi:hypothetical protein